MILPRTDEVSGKPYLSYSQIGGWLRSKPDYIRSYFLNEKFTGNAYTEFGAKVGTALERNDYTGFTPAEAAVLATVPRYDVFERPVTLDMDSYVIKGFTDTTKYDLDHLLDYKTGGPGKDAEYKKPTYIQTIIYALGIEQEMGFLPQTADVYFIQRLGNAFKNEKLTVGPEAFKIHIPITKERLEYAKQLCDKVAGEISKYYEIFLKLNK